MCYRDVRKEVASLDIKDYLEDKNDEHYTANYPLIDIEPIS